MPPRSPQRSPKPAGAAIAGDALTSDDLTTTANTRRGKAFVVFADGYRVVADSLTRWSADHFLTAAPIYDLGLLARALGVLDRVVLVTEIDFAGESMLPILMRARTLRPHLRAIVLSAHCDEFTRGQALAAGAAELVPKSSDTPVLLTAILGAWDEVESEAAVGQLLAHGLTKVPSAHRGSQHDHGPLIAWCLRSGFRQRRIAQALGIASTTVEYHSRQLRLEDISAQ